MLRMLVSPSRHACRPECIPSGASCLFNLVVEGGVPLDSSRDQAPHRVFRPSITGEAYVSLTDASAAGRLGCSFGSYYSQQELSPSHGLNPERCQVQ